jgi:hypothetical protein
MRQSTYLIAATAKDLIPMAMQDAWLCQTTPMTHAFERSIVAKSSHQRP